MNPFQKLRRAVQKVNIEYQIPQDIDNANKTNAYNNRSNENQQLRKTSQKSANSPTFNNNGHVERIVMEQQTKYIQEINQLSCKNQRLAKSLKLIQIEKQNLIQQVCLLEKNNEILEDRIKQVYKNNGLSDDKQRKYKQEIHRINKTIEMLGVQLNTERSAKKSAIVQLNKLKEEHEQQNQRFSKLEVELQQKIERLEGQIRQRSEMLEHYIKKNSQQRRENKIIEQRIKNQYQNKVQELNDTIMKLKDDLSNYRSSYDILNHKFQTITSTHQNIQHKYQGLENQLNHAQQNNKQLQNQVRDAQQRIRQLSIENQSLDDNLRIQKENVKLKVVQIKDQTLELELQMYKRQCKQLLQEKAISQKLGTNRLFEPSYQIFQNK